MAMVPEPLINAYEMIGSLALGSTGQANIDKLVVANDVDVMYQLVNMAFGFRYSTLDPEETFDPIENYGNYAYYYRLRTIFSPHTVGIADGLRRGHVHGSKHLKCNWIEYADLDQATLVWNVENQCVSSLDVVRPSFPRTFTILQKMHMMADLPVDDDMHFLCDPNTITRVHYGAFECPGNQFPCTTFIDRCNSNTFLAFLDQVMSVSVVAHEHNGFLNHNMKVDDILIHYLPRSVYTVCTKIDGQEGSRVVDYPFVASFIRLYEVSYDVEGERINHATGVSAQFKTPVACLRRFLLSVYDRLMTVDDISMVDEKKHDVEVLYRAICGYDISVTYNTYMAQSGVGGIGIHSMRDSAAQRGQAPVLGRLWRDYGKSSLEGGVPDDFKDILPTLFAGDEASLSWSADQITSLSEYPEMIDDDLTLDVSKEQYNLRVEACQKLWVWSMSDLQQVDSSTLSQVQTTIDNYVEQEVAKIRGMQDAERKTMLYLVYNSIITQYVQAFDFELTTSVNNHQLIDPIPWQNALKESLTKFMNMVAIERRGIIRLGLFNTYVKDIVDMNGTEYTFD